MSAQAETFPAPVRSILIVDDDEDTLQGLCDFFILHCFVVYAANNGRRALEVLDGMRDPPGCILLDLQMPVMDGRVVMERLSRRPEAPPVIILTGDDGDAPPGARYYFSKPPPFEVLLRAAVSCSLRQAAPAG